MTGLPISAIANMLRPASSRSASVRREGGIALAEVLIAAVLLVLVSGAFLQLVVGSTQAQTSVKVRQKQQAVSEGLIEQLRLDSKWTKECTEQAAEAGSLDGACVVQVGEMYQDSDFAKDPKTGVVYRIEATATAVDSPGDKQGENDEDGSPVDFFQVKTTVKAPDGTNVGDLTSSSVVDPFSSVATGSVNLDVCAMPGQVDERLVVSSCDGALPMDATSVEATDRAAYDALPEAKRSMQVDPIVSNVRVDGLDDIASVHQTLKTNAAGKVTFDRLKPGRYKVTVLAPPAGLTLWAAKSIAESTISVEPYQNVDAMIAYRREHAADYSIRLEGRTTKDGVSTYSLGVGRTVTLRLLPMPAGRVPIATVPATVTPDGGLATKLTFTAPYPGLYRGTVVNSKKGLEPLGRFNKGVRSTTIDHLWIGSPSLPAGAGEANPDNDDAATYVVPMTVTVPENGVPEEPTMPSSETGPITYPKDVFVPSPLALLGCSWRTPAKVRTLYPWGGAVLPPLNLLETNPGERVCAPCGNVKVKHLALASTVNIRCGLNAACEQNITLSDGVAWFFDTPLSGGSVDVECYQNATCKQSGTVAGNLSSKFVCLPQSGCDQTLAASQSFLTAQVGGAAEVHCYPQARCTQLATMRPGATSRVDCYPNGRCDQRMTSVFTWAAPVNPRNEKLEIECHPDATCTQVLGKTDTWDGIFGARPSGPLTMSCRPQSSCKQTSMLGTFGEQGFQMSCFRKGTCTQSMTVGSFFLGRMSKPARQSCTVAASCTQNIHRSSAAGVLDQMCHEPSKVGKMADQAVGPACDVSGTTTKGIFGWGIASNTLLQCTTGEWCKMTLTGGGWGSFTGRKPYRELCISKLDCNQSIVRYADFFSGITEAYQDCQSSTGSCTQFARIVDDSFFGNGTGPRRQLCDSRQSCTQDLRGTESDSLAAWSFFGTTNDIYQLCNEAIPDLPPPSGPPGDPSTDYDDEPEGDFDPDSGGTGGA